MTFHPPSGCNNVFAYALLIAVTFVAGTAVDDLVEVVSVVPLVAVAVWYRYSARRERERANDLACERDRAREIQADSLEEIELLTAKVSGVKLVLGPIEWRSTAEAVALLERAAVPRLRPELPPPARTLRASGFALLHQQLEAIKRNSRRLYVIAARLRGADVKPWPIQVGDLNVEAALAELEAIEETSP